MASTLKFNNRSEYAWLQRIDPSCSVLGRRGYVIAKRMMDLMLLLLFLPILIAVFGIIALLIKIESPDGPVMFTQKRTGKGGKTFRMYKFRTMVPNAEAMKKELAHLNELQWPDFKISNDPRITKVGRILRKTSLDELPQLLNVWKNEMSFIGPRPTSFSADTYALWQTERLDVLPGLSGLWQLFGRGTTEFNDRLLIDIAYIEKRCLWLDVQILFRTIPAVLKQRGAH